MLWNCIWLIAINFLTMAQNRPIDGLVAVVGNSPIFNSDIVQLKDRIKKGILVNDLIAASLESLNPNDHKTLLQYLIYEKILDHEVKKNKIQVPENRLQAEIQQIAQRNGMSTQDFKKFLNQENIQWNEYQDFLRQRMEHQSLLENVLLPQIRITDEELQAYYFQKYRKPVNHSFKVDLWQIVLPKDKAKQSGCESAKNLLSQWNQKMISSLKEFQALADRYSIESSWNHHLGEFTKNDLEKPLALAIEKQAQAGLLPEVFEFRKKCHIFYIQKFEKILDPNFLKIKNQLQGELMERQIKHELKQWLESQRVLLKVTVIRQPFEAMK